METTTPTKLAIDGKVINIEKISEKTLAQFKAQLKQNGLTIDDARAEQVYLNCRGELTAEQAARKAAVEAKVAQIKAEAQAQAEAIKAKYNK